MSKLRVVGFDPSLRNWGVACGTLHLTTGTIEITQLEVIQPALSKGKQVRQNSLDLETAYQLARGALDVIRKEPHAIFVEVPVGSQSARAMASYGVCVGVLGALRAQGTPFYELTPTEVKLASVGSKTATKDEMIQWARKCHPFAPWPMYTVNGKQQVSAAKAEHMADAVAAIYAGVTSNPFRQAMRHRA